MGLAPGAKVGAYEIVDALGRGGMGEVYRVLDASLDREVALKILPREFLHDPTFSARFRREARIIARLEHRNIVPVYAFDIEAEQGIAWMALRLLRGGSLADLLVRERPPFDRAIAVLRGVADALDYAHGRGIVHRDVKPQNVLLDESGAAYLADFGIARMIEGDGSKITATGMVTGSPHYMAPEQATGAKVGHHTDIYSLAIVAYEALTGRIPFSADSPVAVLMRQVQDPLPIPPPEVLPARLWEPILRGAAKRPEDRWPSAGEFVAALESGLSSVPECPSSLATTWTPSRTSTLPSRGAGPGAATVTAHPGATRAEQASRARKGRTLRWALASIGLALAAATGLYALFGGGPQEPPDAAAVPTPASPQDTHPASPQQDGGEVSTDEVHSSVPQPTPRQEAEPPVAPEPPPSADPNARCGAGDATACLNLGTQYQSGDGVRKDEARAVELYRKACDAGGPDGCRHLGAMYEDGHGVSKDEARAAELYGKGCDAGDAPGCFKLGRLYANGRGVPKDEVRAVGLYGKACGAEDAKGCNNLGFMYANGHGVPKDEVRAVELFRKACDAGVALGCHNLGLNYSIGRGIPKDEGRAVELYGKACDAGLATGCRSLGLMYMTGQGVPRDDTRAAELYRAACDAGDAPGCRSLGFMYEVGRGVPKDERRAVELFGKACDAEDLKGCNNLGSMYSGGRGIPKDEVRAVELFRKACDAGVALGCGNLGLMYMAGRGVARDDTRAAELLRKACDAGHAEGCANLAAMYVLGRGVTRDDTRAVELLSKACDAGLASSCSSLGHGYAEGRGVPRDDTRAAELFRAACDAGDAPGCGNLGFMYEVGRGVSKDQARAVELFRKACAAGDSYGCRGLDRLGGRD